MAQGARRPVRWPRAVAGREAPRRSGAGPDGVPVEHVVGRGGPVRREGGRGACEPPLRGRPSCRARQGLRRDHRPPGRCPRAPPPRGRCHRARGPIEGSARAGGEGRCQAMARASRAAVHHQHAPAGGQPQATMDGEAHHARGPVALRAWLDHLHAHRQRSPVRSGGERRAPQHRRPVRAALPPRRRATTRATPRMPRRRTRRSVRRAPRSGRSRRGAPSSTSTRPGSTSSCGSARWPRRWRMPPASR